ncbi:hypothetical protein HGB13_04575 [bacterium]|nr:hypothetical protein [bacterium]
MTIFLKLITTIIGLIIVTVITYFTTMYIGRFFSVMILMGYIYGVVAVWKYKRTEPVTKKTDITSTDKI